MGASLGVLPQASARTAKQHVLASGVRNVLARRAKRANARVWIRRANKLYLAGRFARAVKLFERAYAATNRPAFLFNLGQCYRQLDQCTKATRYYHQYLLSVPGSKNRGLVERGLAYCEAQFKKAQQASEAAKEPPPEATSTESEHASEKERQREDELASQTPLQCQPSIVRVSAPCRFDGSTRRPSSTVLWSTIIAATALVAGGAATTTLALKLSDEYNNAETPLEDRPALRRSGQQLRTASYVLFGLATAVAGAGAVWHLTRTPNRETSISAVATPSHAGVTVRGKF